MRFGISMGVSLCCCALVLLHGSASAAGAVANSSKRLSSCNVHLTTSEARTLAASIPNARAFAAQGYKLSMVVAGSAEKGQLPVRVDAMEGGRRETVGIYMVNLKTGVVLDDDQEPADDDRSVAERHTLIEKHCGQ